MPLSERRASLFRWLTRSWRYIDSTGKLISTNDNWRSTQQNEIVATGIAPTNDSESAILLTLDPGSYTAIVRGQNNTTGVALVEVYNLDSASAASK